MISFVLPNKMLCIDFDRTMSRNDVILPNEMCLNFDRTMSRNDVFFPTKCVSILIGRCPETGSIWKKNGEKTPPEAFLGGNVRAVLGILPLSPMGPLLRYHFFK